MLTQTQDRAPGTLPIWLSIPIILLCLGAGGSIIHWYVMTDPISHESKILGDAPAQAVWGGGGQGGPGRIRQPGQGGAPGGQPRNRPAPAPKVRAVVFDENNGDFQVRTEKATARLSVVKGKASIRVIQYRDTSFIPKDALDTIATANKLHRDQAQMESMKLEIPQQNRLGGLSNTLYPPMVLSAADKDTLTNAASGYAANPAQRAALEPTILQTLDAIADRSKDATRQATVDRVSKINQIVTPDMWKQFAAAGGK